MQALANYFKNWLTPYSGQHQDPVVSQEAPPPPPQETPSKKEENITSNLDETNPEIVEAKKNLTDTQNKELSELLGLLRVEALSHCEKRVRTAYDKVKTTRTAQNELNQLYKLFTDSPSADGSVTLAQDETIRTSLHKARGHGIAIAENKYTFTKEEKDRTLQQVERKTADLDTDLKLYIHEVTEATKMHDLYLQTLKSMEEKQDRAKERASRAISGS